MKKDSNILEELAALNAGALQNAENNNFYTVPEGYFTNLASDVVAHIKVETIPVANLYFVPENYFETLSASILNKVYVDAAVHSFPKKQTFSVPDNYFKNLSTNILQRIKKENNSFHQELEEIAPLLSSIPKTNVYSTPEGYFEENLSPAIQSKSQPAKIISLKTKKRRWINYAAACIAFVLFGGGYLYYDSLTNHIAGMNVQKEIAQLPDNAINNYLNNDKTEVYFQTDFGKQNLDVQSMLNNASDEEIENYLLKNSDPGEQPPGI